MKRLLFLLSALAIAQLGISQNLIAERFSDYQQKEQVTNIHISAKMFELANYLEDAENDPELEEFRQFLTTMKSFDMIVERDMEETTADYTRAIGKVPPSHEEVMKVDDAEGQFTFYIDEANGRVYELAMIGRTQEEFMVFSLTGDMDLKQLVKMASHIEAQEFRQMGKFSQSGLQEFKLYPNPAEANSSLNLEVPSEMVGATAVWYNLKGQVLRQSSVSSSKEKISTNGLSAGTYILALEKEGVSLKQRVVLR